MIGFLGPIIFETSTEMGRTFHQFQRQRKFRYAVHDVLDGSQVLQYTGHDLDEISLSVRLATDMLGPFGTNPRLELEALKRMAGAGAAYFLILGLAPLGDFVIEEVSERWLRITNHGTLTAAEVEVKLREYA